LTYSWNTGSTTADLYNAAAGTYTVTVRDVTGSSAVKSATITVPSAIVVTVSNIVSATNGANGSATVTATGGTPPYRHVWSNGFVGNTATGLAPGQYYVCTFDANNCQSDLFITIPGTPQSFPLTFTFVAPTCFGYTNGSATVTPVGGTAPYTYHWDNGQQNSTNYSLSGGSYTVTVTDKNGLTSTGVVSIPQPAALSLSFASGASVCQPGSTLSVSATGGTGLVTFNWSGGSTGNSVPVNGGGTFFVTATDANGCAQAAAYNVSGALDVEIKINNSPCGSLPNGGSLGAVVHGGTGPFTYVWSNGTTDPALQNASAGVYTVTVTDANGCSAVKSAALVTPSVINVTVVQITPACGGANGSATVTATGGTPPYRHVWSNGFVGNTATGLAPGQYYVCTFDANNCQHDIFITIPGSGGLNLNLSAKNTACVGVNNGIATVAVTPATGNFTYQWSMPNAPNSNSIIGLAANTTVSVTVTESTTGCQGQASVTIGADPGLSLTVNKTDLPCTGTDLASATAVPVGAAGSVNYVWTWPNNTTTTGVQVSGLDAGSYKVEARDAQGCAATATFEILRKGVNLNTSNVVVACGSQNVTLSASANAGTTFRWFDANGNPLPNGSSTGSSSSVTVAAGTAVATYRVEAENAGCTDSRTVQVKPNDSLALDLKLTPARICTGTTATWEATVTNGGSNVNYQWSANGLNISGGNTNTATLSGPIGVYTVTVRASNADNSCSVSKTAELTIEEKPVLTLVNPGAGCNPQVLLTANASAGASVVWYNSNNVQVATGNTFNAPSGIYRVEAANQCGTASTTTEAISRAVEADLASAQVCVGETAMLSVNNKKTGDLLTYAWTVPVGVTISSPVVANPTVSATAGSYNLEVVVKNQFGCMLLLQTPLTVAEKPTLTVDKDRIIACDKNVTLSATSNANLVWQNATGNTVGVGSSITIPAGTATSVYTVTAASAPNCSVSKTVEVMPAAVDIRIASTPSTVCERAPAQWAVINQNPQDTTVRYTWTVSNGITITGSTTANATLSGNAGTYIVTVKGTNSAGCASETAATLTVIKGPEVSVLSDTAIACKESITLQATANAGAQLIWYNANGDSLGVGPVLVRPVSGDAVYTVRAGIPGCPNADAATVQVLDRALEVDLDRSNPTQVCLGTTPTWKATGYPSGATLNWTASNGINIVNGNSAAAGLSPLDAGQYIVTVKATNGGCTAEKSDTLVVERAVARLIQDAICTCNGSVSFTALTDGNANPLTWYNANGDSIASGPVLVRPVDGNATYVVVAKTPGGCMQADTAYAIDSAVKATLDSKNPLAACENGDVQWGVVKANPTDSLKYQWSGPAGIVFSSATGALTNIRASAPGTYPITVTVESSDRCCKKELTALLVINEKTDPGATASLNTCDDKVLSFATTATSEGTWSFGDGTTSANTSGVHTYAQAGNYTVKFQPKDACVKSMEKQVQVKGVLPVAAAIGSSLKSCIQNAEFQFNDQSTAAAGIQSWNWTFSPGTQTSALQNPTAVFAGGSAVTATLIVTDKNGCKDTVVTQVTADVVDESVAEQVDFCKGNSVRLNPDFNAAYTYQWTAQPADPNLDINSSNPAVSPAVVTTYTVTVKNGNCEIQYAAKVTPKESIPVSLPDDKTLCDNNPFTLRANAPAGTTTFEWSQSATFQPLLSNAGDTLRVNPAAGATKYYVRAGNVGACAGVDSMIVLRAPVRIEGVPADRTVCAGNETELTVTNLNPADIITNYAWSNSQLTGANPKLTPPTGNSTYTVTVTNGAKCTQSLSFAVKTLDVSVEARTDRDTLCFGQTAQLNATATGATDYVYNWTPATTLTGANISNPIAQPEEDMTYTVTVTGDKVCTATATVSILFISNQCVEPYIFVPKAFTPNDDGNNDHFIVRGVNIKDLYFVVWNRWGEKMFETEDVNSKGWDGSFGGKELTPDSYSWYVRVTCGNGATYTKKGDVTLLK
jgi:gliding motility-associated-like protein